jgi:hypothetical protein
MGLAEEVIANAADQKHDEFRRPGAVRVLRTTSEGGLIGSRHLLWSFSGPGIAEIRYCPWCGEEIEVVRVK